MESGATSQDGAHRDRRRRRLPYLVGSAIVVVVVGWLLYTNIGGATAPYMTVSQVLAGGASDRIVRAMGNVVGDSIVWDPEELLLQFDLTEDEDSISVRYHGARPDLLQDGIQAVVEGRYQGEGRFEAAAILLKCPSKYQEE